MQPRDRQRLFDMLYAEHRTALHAYFLGRTNDAELALDLLQEVFLRAWRSSSSLDALEAGRRKFWLFSVARNLVVDQYRAGGTRRATQEALQRATEPRQHAEPADAVLVQREQLAELDRAIRRLPEDLRVVLVLRLVGERTSTEIGELLGKPAGTVRYQLAEARQRLANDLRLGDNS